MNKILIAYDGGEPARRALQSAIELARKFEATLSVVSVVPVHPGRVPIDPWDDTAIHADELVEARSSCARPASRPSSSSPSGDPAKTIERIDGRTAGSTPSSSARAASGRSIASSRAASPSTSRPTPTRRW